jgi:hypothetical protein
MQKIILLSAILLLVGCTPPPPDPKYHEIDPDKLLNIAGREAGLISNVRDRITRQLNIANRENNNNHFDDARKTLSEARKTMESPAASDFSDQERLAGWISISELSRGASDRDSAGYALDKAIDYLHKLMPVNARPEYVHGVAREINALRGQSDSAKLIAESGNWAVEIPETQTRRQALVSFSRELCRCGDYDSALKMLQYDKDAAWRSDTLIAMSDNARRSMATGGSFLASGLGMQNRVPTETEGESPASQSPNAQFGKSLDFKSNYYRK